MNSRRQNEKWRGPKTIGVDLQRSGSIRRVPLPKCSSADADETDDRKIFHIAPLPYFAWGSASKRYFATHECWEKAGCYNKNDKPLHSCTPVEIGYLCLPFRLEDHYESRRHLRSTWVGGADRQIPA